MRVLRIFLLCMITVSLIGSDPALAAKKKKKKIVPGNLEYSRSENAKQFPPVIFPHWRHVTRFRCYACHSDLFEMELSEGLGEAMHKTDKCGSCHSGEPAFVVSIKTCHRCHIGETVEEPGKKKKKDKKKKKTKKDRE